MRRTFTNKPAIVALLVLALAACENAEQGESSGGSESGPDLARLSDAGWTVRPPGPFDDDQQCALHHSSEGITIFSSETRREYRAVVSRPRIERDLENEIRSLRRPCRTAIENEAYDRHGSDYNEVDSFMRRNLDNCSSLRAKESEIQTNIQAPEAYNLVNFSWNSMYPGSVVFTISLPEDESVQQNESLFNNSLITIDFQISAEIKTLLGRYFSRSWVIEDDVAIYPSLLDGLRALENCDADHAALEGD